jgi:uncharacterized protein (UPF0212 family)
MVLSVLLSSEGMALLMMPTFFVEEEIVTGEGLVVLIYTMFVLQAVKPIKASRIKKTEVFMLQMN